MVSPIMDSFIGLVLLKTFLGIRWLTKGITTNQKTTMLAMFQLINSEKGTSTVISAKGMASVLLRFEMLWFFIRLYAFEWTDSETSSE